MKHLADTIVDSYDWLDLYASTNRRDGVKKRSWLTKTNWLSIMAFCICMVTFESYMMEEVPNNLGIVVWRFFFYVPFLLGLWVTNGVVLHLHLKREFRIVRQWYMDNKDRTSEWNSLDRDIIASRLNIVVR